MEYTNYTYKTGHSTVTVCRPVLDPDERERRMQVTLNLIKEIYKKKG